MAILRELECITLLLKETILTLSLSKCGRVIKTEASKPVTIISYFIGTI